MKEIRHPEGLKILENLLELKQWHVLSDNDLMDNDFMGQSKRALEYVREYYGLYREFPTKDVLEQELNIVFPAKSPLDFSIKLVKKAKLHGQLKEVIEKSHALLVRNDPDAARSVLIEMALQTQPTSKLVTFKGTALERFNLYKASKLVGLKGIVPPWPSLKEAIAVWEAGTLNAILGVSSTGKSWLAVVAAVFAAFTQDSRVLLVTKENSKASMENRADSFYHKVPFGDLRRGWVDMRTEKKWLEGVEEIQTKKGDIIIADDIAVKTVSDILQLVHTYEPNFVVVDGAYKLQARGKDFFEQSSNVLSEMHHAAGLTKIPWLATSQLNPDATKAKGGRDTAYNARGNKNWMTDPATVMTLTQTEDQRLLNYVECRIAKIREAGDVTDLDMTFLMKQDRQLMEFDEVVDQFEDTEILKSLTD